MNDSSKIIKDFASLFNGRTDAYGSWEGGCIKETVTENRFMKHLWGQEYIGIYPMMDNNKVWWGCSDIDVNDIDQARNIQLALKLKNIDSWVEKTVKGFHVWVFGKEPIEARVMRRALLAAHTVAKVPAKEINPKQETTSGYGNYVRLPYPGALFEPSSVRYMIDNSDNPISLENFVDEAIYSNVMQSDLEPLARMHMPPKPIAKFDTSIAALPTDVIKSYLSPYTLRLFMGGPVDNMDRSNTLVRLVHRLKDDKVPPDVAYGILRAADMRWGKFFLREDGELHLAKIVADVYAE